MNRRKADINQILKEELEEWNVNAGRVSYAGLQAISN